MVFLDVRTNNILKINVEVKDAQFEFVVMTNEIETAADIIQDLVIGYLDINEFQSLAHFPEEFKRLQQIIEDIDEANAMRTHFAANISENINNVKVSIVKAESSLLIDDIDSMKRYYAFSQQENGAMFREYL